MHGSYCIAYKDKNRDGYFTTKPWILDDFGDDLEQCLLNVATI